ncbi:Uncharacterised protein [Mycobacteroides abscessus]|nr:Uncharacterised protein [Mycobacteroides abscessus]
MVSTINPTTNNAVAAWRHVRGRVGATESNSSVFANRSTRFCRRYWATTYRAIRAATNSSTRKNHGWAKPVRVIGPKNGTSFIESPPLFRPPRRGVVARRTSRCR